MMALLRLVQLVGLRLSNTKILLYFPNILFIESKMSEKLSKYRFAVQHHDEALDAYAEKINALADVNYKVHTIDIDQGVALMVLDVGNYEGVTNLKDVASIEVDDYLAQGWEIASASISTKFVRMVRRLTSKVNQDE